MTDQPHAVGCRCTLAGVDGPLLLSAPCAALRQPTRLQIATALLGAGKVYVLRGEGVETEWQREMCRSALRLADMLIEESQK